ncbi:hypothetical protein [Actinomadura parmotrematis]|uniref:Uncharacterized protein n=1 Tax=Actinomadura parmotrematis TaxID=2864039 RepID=A0ABS7FNV1_9ACTN|nr:hypothetical protein [Actinomadura parmotrematis]MBW8482069.1 hypothetical protein [Actinomadura parmotrematis]
MSRPVLAVKAGGPWLVLVGGTWAVDTENESGVRLGRGRMWLLPLLERSREEVESEARARLGAGDPDVGEALRAVIGMGLDAWSDHWLSKAVAWMTDEEVVVFSERLHEIALESVGPRSQDTRHAAKRRLERLGLWSPDRE